MRGIKLALICAIAGSLAWLTAIDPTGAGNGPVQGPWEASFLLMGVAAGIALTRIWRVHEQLARPQLHFLAGVLVLGAGILGIGLKEYGSFVRVMDPVALMVGQTWTMVGMAGIRSSRA
ncbi:MAG TPA: hypothetical protein VIL07_07855 [Symbiobacteriaceae bacterium]